MSYLVFARKWRPQDFDEIAGQEHIASTLKNAIKLNRVAQAYLFAGPRGVGKTSTARILAKALNCEKGPTQNPCNKCTNCLETAAANSLDVIEIDGASNRGIDEIRTLRENAKLAPMRGRFKIYIIDEVHQITDAAFNALLKTLEEPPPHVKFIFATTQPNKIPATIVSRCQRFDFRRVPVNDIVKKLSQIAKAEKIAADENVLFEIAKASDGSLRDAESILDQLNSFCERSIQLADLTKILGVIEDELFLSLADFILKKDITSILQLIDGLVSDGRDLSQFLAKFTEHVRDLTVLKINKNLKSTLALSDAMLDAFCTQAQKFGLEDLIYMFYLLANTYEAARKTGLMRFSMEFAFIKIVKRQDFAPIDRLLERIDKLEKTSPPAQNPGRPDPEPAPAAPNGDLAAAWPDVIQILSAKKTSLASFLMEGEPAQLENGVLKVDFPKIHSFHKEILEEPENRKIVEKICKDVFGTAVKIEFRLVENFQRKNNFKFMTQEEKKKETDPLLKDAMDVFNGSVIKNDKDRFNG
jgi:DNA polymerase-3 subunit gamma/tau